MAATPTASTGSGSGASSGIPVVRLATYAAIKPPTRSAEIRAIRLSVDRSATAAPAVSSMITANVNATPSRGSSRRCSGTSPAWMPALAAHEKVTSSAAPARVNPAGRGRCNMRCLRQPGLASYRWRSKLQPRPAAGPGPQPVVVELRPAGREDLEAEDEEQEVVRVVGIAAGQLVHPAEP